MHDQPPRRRRGLRITALITSGFILLGAAGYVGWEFLGTAAAAATRTGEQVSDLRAQWQAFPPAPERRGRSPQAIANPAIGQAHWLMRIPSLWGDVDFPVVAGVDGVDLTGSVGWYPGTSQPGQLGNFGVTGHCLTRGEPFRRLRELPAGAQVAVETHDAIFTYELISSAADLTVQDDDSWVLAPVPGRPDESPSQAVITLTTCEDLYPTPDRSVAFGILRTTELK
jgi:sortase family protein